MSELSGEWVDVRVEDWAKLQRRDRRCPRAGARARIPGWLLVPTVRSRARPGRSRRAGTRRGACPTSRHLYGGLMYPVDTSSAVHAAQKTARNIGVDRFYAKVVAGPNGCHIWTASLGSGGYGQFRSVEGGRIRTRRAHRWAYELHRGPVPEGLDLDHLCRVRRCVNPWHLEAVTRGENVRRGASEGTYGSYQKSRTECPYGHAFDEENTYRHPVSGRRACRTCKREDTRRRRTYKKGA